MLRSDGKRSNANSVLVEYHDRTALDRFFYVGKILDEKGKLFIRSPVRASPKQNDRRFARAVQRQQCAEIRVRGQNDAVFAGGPIEDLLVLGGMQPVVSHVYSIVTGAAQPGCQLGRKSVINQELQGAASGSSRSRTASAAYCNAS